MDVHLLGAGEWSRAYAFILDDRQAVIRFGDHVEDFRKDQVMAAYSSAALPVPAVMEIGVAGDVYFAVFDRAPCELLDGLDGDRMRARAAGPAVRAGRPAGHRRARHGRYGIWAPDGTSPAATWAQALLGISQVTARVPG